MFRLRCTPPSQRRLPHWTVPPQPCASRCPVKFTGKRLDLVSTDKYRLEPPFRIIFHVGKYHYWVMRYPAVAKGPPSRSDGEPLHHLDRRHTLESQGPVSRPRKGSMDEGWRESLQAVKFDGKFWISRNGKAVTLGPTT